MIELADYQVDAVRRLHNGSILCGGVGSGKSRTALAYYYTKVCDGVIPIDGELIFGTMKTPRDLYVITTARKRDTGDWYDEAHAFGLDRDPKLNEAGLSIFVDSWNNIGKYTSVVGGFFIFDEQRVVGSGAWVKAFQSICKKNKWILLSATPGDTWMDYIPVFIANGFYKNRTQFLREHVVFSPYVKWPKVQRYLNVQRLIQIRDSLLVTMAYDKKTVTHYVDISVDYNEVQYRKIQDTRWNFEEGMPIRNASEYCALLRKTSCNDESRIEATKELIRQNPKVIIFYNFDYELENLRRLCQTEELIFAEWNGHKHQPIPNSSNWVYLVQYSAGAEAWNCIETNAIIFFSLNYSYRISVQAAGRIDRRNTPFKDLYVYRLISDSSIDQAILNCLENKQDFNEKAFMGPKYVA